MNIPSSPVRNPYRITWAPSRSRLSWAAMELDLNPIFALPPGQGCRTVDARIRINHVDSPLTQR